MRIVDLCIHNFKSIKHMYIHEVENALILVGQNNTGKSTVLDAIRAVGGLYQIKPVDFSEDNSNIEIYISLQIFPEDIDRMISQEILSQYHNREAWQREFARKLPSYKDGILTFQFVANKEGKVRYQDGVNKHNPYIKDIFPKIYYIDAQRDLDELQEDLLLLQEDELLKMMRSDCCMFNKAKKCDHCFECIGLINKKSTAELNAFETAKLLDYKLFKLNLDEYATKVNSNFRKNGGQEEILYSMNRDMDRMLTVTTEMYNKKQDIRRPISRMGKGMRSIYMLSLLETYTESDTGVPSIIMIEEPEIFLHPTLQNVCGDILYRLSKKNQVIYTTHSPNLLPNFNSKEIRQVVVDDDGYPMINIHTDISRILDDLGYSANDLMNVNFVFIVEGRQDKSRLPLLLKKYYNETYDESGNLSRIAIIATNSCTNIKTYANLKYMNQVYLKDKFLMIRDGDGKDREELVNQLCKYYDERNNEEIDKLPRVTKNNVLVLKYYSFENYFFNPKVMALLHVVESEDAFYNTLYEKWVEYLHRLKSGKHLIEIMGRDFIDANDMKEHMEEIRQYLRGHNLYDLFYGPYIGREASKLEDNIKDKRQLCESRLLEEYMELAPKEDFEDILEAIDRFIYFQSKKTI